MKVAFDYKIFYRQKFGCPSRYFSELFENLNEHYCDTHIVSPIYTNEYLKNSKYLKNIHGVKFSSRRFFGKFYEYLNNNISELVISRMNPEIIHTTYYDDVLMTQKKPIVLTVHDLIHEIFYKDFGFEKYFKPKKKMIDRADHIICVSKSTKKDLIEYYNVDEKKISVIYHGVTKKENIGNYSLKEKKPFFLYIGSRKRYKNFKIFLEAYCLNSLISKNFNIICFGGGLFLDEEHKLFESLSIDKTQITNISGDDNTLTYLYKNAQALIYPSLYEGFGMPILEAMRLKCPVISSNSSSLPEVYGNTCLSFNPNSKIELAEHLNTISNNNDFKNKIIQDAFLRSKIFSWEKCARETMDVYESLL